MLAINQYNCKFNTYNHVKPPQKRLPAFGMHPEYKEDYNVSFYFRRGDLVTFKTSDDFQDVIEVLAEYYKKNTKPMDLLIAGVANAQEPFSMLAVINDINQGKTLNNLVDLNCVDLRPKILPHDFEWSNTYLKYGKDYAPGSFIEKGDMREVKPHIVHYLNEVFENPEKTHWDTKIQDFSRDCEPEKYDLISINNLLYYIKQRKERDPVLKNLQRMLKTGGIIITDPYDRWYKDYKDMKEIKPGIYRKLA